MVAAERTLLPVQLIPIIEAIWCLLGINTSGCTSLNAKMMIVAVRVLPMLVPIRVLVVVSINKAMISSIAPQNTKVS